jgi:predicted amidohydrolase
MSLKVVLAQLAPCWLRRQATLQKVLARKEHAAQQAARLVVFGEALVPGYPFWPELTDGGSCVAGPDGRWLLEPQVEREGLCCVDLAIEAVARERQKTVTFDD